jgi:hypothetical protein
MMNLGEETYLGDGLYASFDGLMFKLRAPREDGDHWVGLDPDVFNALIRFRAKTFAALEAAWTGTEPAEKVAKASG